MISLAVCKAVSSLTPTERAARLTFNKANQEGRLIKKGAPIALDRANEDMCLTNEHYDKGPVYVCEFELKKDKRKGDPRPCLRRFKNV
jgi:hypothetical protein